MKRILPIVLLALAGCAADRVQITSLPVPVLPDYNSPQPQRQSNAQTLFFSGPDGMVIYGPKDAAASIEVGSDGIARLK